jgi:hypothetical protein
MRVDINSRPAGLDDPLVVALPEGEFLVLRCGPPRDTPNRSFALSFTPRVGERNDAVLVRH